MNVPLSTEMHAALFQEAKRAGKPATRIVREVLAEWLAARERARRDAEIERFAAEFAGTDVDLDPELEAAAVEALRSGADDAAR